MTTGVLLFHGLTSGPDEMANLRSALYHRNSIINCPVICLPGHGTNIEELIISNDYDWVDHACDAWNRLDSFCDEIIIGGSSMGGLLALFMAASNNLKIKKVLLYSPAIKLKWRVRLFGRLMHRLYPSAVYKKQPDHGGYPVIPLKSVIDLMNLQKGGCFSGINADILCVSGFKDDTISIPHCDALPCHTRIKLDIDRHDILRSDKSNQIINHTLEFLKS